jgi:hypothetical protein
MLNEKTINNKSDIQKTLTLYISIIQDLHKNIKLSYNEIQKQLIINFNYKASIEDIILYYEANLREEIIDIQLLTNNLGIRYV